MERELAEIAAAPGGDRFATASSDGTARVWRREGGAEHDFAAEADAPPRNAAGAASAKRRKASARGVAAAHVPGAAPARSCLDFGDDAGDDDGPLARRRFRQRRRRHQGRLLLNRPRLEFRCARLRSRVLPRAVERVLAVVPLRQSLDG